MIDKKDRTLLRTVLNTVRHFYAILTKTERELVRNHYSISHYKRNDVIFAEGDVPSEFMCLLKGEIKINKKGLSDRGHIVRMVKPVGFFGYRAIFCDEQYISSAIANNDVTILTIPKEIMQSMLLSNHALVLRFLQELASALRFSDERVISLTQKHVRGRLAETILVLKDMYGVDEDGASLSIIMSREDLAEFSNMTTASCIRTLSTLVAEKVLAVDGRRIKIINLNELERISKIG